ncbi:MAG: SDR family oxidoreductase [Alphaproteobacteria bacterium]|nr:SDR family oxidoreductase [Alphaproteobacteria bacterium]
MIAILGANGLIGHALALDLKRRGFEVRGIARSFTTAQRAALNGTVQAPLVNLDPQELAQLLEGADMVINTIGILQGPDSDAVHRQFAARLAAVCGTSPQKLLVHLSLPGEEKADRTAYSLTKREGERAIAAGGAPFVILRPGFVIATAAYGGSALMRALAALPLNLPPRESGARFAATAMNDLCETVAHVARRWQGGERNWDKTWDVMEPASGTVGDIVAAFRARNGGPKPLMATPGWLLAPGAVLGDVAARLGWKPPIRSTAVAEMRRGVVGNPQGWMRDTGITPLSASEAVAATPATIQEKWFARLYLMKAAALVTLVIFWCASGTIALTVAFPVARQTLVDHGFPFALAHGVTIASSLMDISIGLLIAVRRTSAIGLVAGIVVSLGYMAAAAIFTPDMWIEPLGALVKTFPAIVLMLFCLLMLDDR